MWEGLDLVWLCCFGAGLGTGSHLGAVDSDVGSCFDLSVHLVPALVGPDQEKRVSRIGEAL